MSKRDIGSNTDINLYSFDIFDTLITRTTATPAGIFSIMEYHLEHDAEYIDFPEILKKNFYTIRRETEHFAHTNCYVLKKQQEIKFKDIYEFIRRNYNLSDSQTERLMNLEIETEKLNLKPVTDNINLVKQLISEGKRVILISDMYYNSSVIREFLTGIDDVFKDITIYVSCEYSKTKSSGKLYEAVKEAENADYSKWLHMGDNWQADIERAIQLGINAKFYIPFEFMTYERGALYKSLLNEGNLYIQSLIGIAKYTRVKSDNKSDVYQFGCSFAAPILYGYVCWVLEQIQSRGLKHVYFLARDGYVLKEIADKIIDKKHLDIKTKYIYGSRKAWRIPTEETYDDYINYSFEDFRSMFSIKFIADRLNLKISDLTEVFKVNNIDKVLNTEQIENLKDIVLQNNDIKSKVIENNQSEELLEYIKQEFDLSEAPIALVDLYGTGRTQDLFKSLIKKYIKSNASVIGFYMHSEPHVVQYDDSLKLAYIETFNNQVYTIELLCRSIHGQTVGYRKENNKIVPVLDAFDSEKMLNWGFNDYLQALIDYTINAADFEKNNNISLDSYIVQQLYLCHYRSNRDNQLAEIIGSIPYLSIGDESQISECAPKFSMRDFSNLLFRGNAGYYSWLNQLSVCRSDNIYRKLFEFNAKYGNIFKYCQYILFKKIPEFIFYLSFSKKREHSIIRIFGIKIQFKNWRYKGGKWEKG